MKFSNSQKVNLSTFVLFTTTLLVCQSLLSAQIADKHKPSASSISLTVVPHAGKGGSDQTEPISGAVKGVDIKTFKIVIYALAGGAWWVQPTVASPLTDIDSSGDWQTITHLGTTYAVLLVNQSYRPPATIKDVPKVGDGIAAVKLVQGESN